MNGVRIQPVNAELFLVDVVCSCGRNGLTNVETWQSSFKHEVLLTGNDVKLVCMTCQDAYLIHPQGDHLHVAKVNLTDAERRAWATKAVGDLAATA